MPDEYSDNNDGTQGKNNNNSDDIRNNNLNTRQELFEILEDNVKKIKALELELNMTKTKNKQNKKKVQEDYQWTGEEINFSDTVNHFCKSLLFPKYRFLKEGWQDYRPDKRNSLYLLCMQNLKIPEGAKKEDIWERVIVPSKKMKYINIKGNINNNIKKIYESMTIMLHTFFVNNSFLLTNLLYTLLITLTQVIPSRVSR